MNTENKNIEEAVEEVSEKSPAPTPEVKEPDISEEEKEIMVKVDKLNKDYTDNIFELYGFVQGTAFTDENKENFHKAVSEIITGTVQIEHKTVQLALELNPSAANLADYLNVTFDRIHGMHRSSYFTLMNLVAEAEKSFKNNQELQKEDEKNDIGEQDKDKE